MCFYGKLKTGNFWTFQLGTQESISIPIIIFVCFQQRYRQDSQNIHKDTFYRPPVTITQCIMGTAKYPDPPILLNFDDKYYSQWYGQSEEACKVLTKDDIPNSYITDHDFRSTNVNDAEEDDYSIYWLKFICFWYTIKEKSKATQPVTVEFEFSDKFLDGIYAYALVLTNKLVGISSVGQRHFD